MKKTVLKSLMLRSAGKGDVKRIRQDLKEFISSKRLLLGLALTSIGSCFAQSPAQKPEAPLWGITYYEPYSGSYISCENNTTCHVNICVGDTLWLCPDEQPATNAHIYWYATVNGQPNNYTTPFCTSSYNSPSPAGCGFAGYFVPTASGVYNINYNAFGNVNWYDNSFGYLQVTVNAMPNYAITANPNPSTIYTQPVAFTLTPPAQGMGNNYDLFFGDGYDVGTVSTANHTYGATGVYNACVLFTDSNGFCAKNVCKTITVSNPTLTASMTTNTSTCGGSSVTAQGYYSGNVTPDHYYWEITQTDQYGNVTSPGYTWSSWFPGAPISGSTFTFPGSNTLPCNKYYRITFAVQNTTIPGLGWEASTTFIYVNCPPTPVFSGNLDICSGSSTTLCQNYLPSSLYTITWTGAPKGALHNQCITVSPTTNTTYDVTVTNNNTHCSSTNSLTVHVYNNNPSFSTSNNTSNSSYYTVTCTGNDLTATSQPGFGYSWIVEDLTAASTYTVTNPSAWWTFPSTSFCGLNPIGNSYSGNVNTSTINSNCSTSNPSIGHYQYNHTYRITRGTWNTYCPWAQASITFSVPPSPHLMAGSNNVSNMSVISENSGPDYSYTKNTGETVIKTALADEETMTVFPNPSTGLLNVRIDNPTEDAYQVEVYDMFGKLLYKSADIASGRADVSAEIDLRSLKLSKGLYMVTVSSASKKLVKKIMIE